jgi:hypothetical protein
MRGLILLALLVLGVGLFAQKDFDLSLKNLDFGEIKHQIKDEINKVQHPKLRHIKTKKKTENDETFHETPPGCVDLEGRVLVPLSARCK